MLCHAISCYIVNSVQIILVNFTLTVFIWSRGYRQASEIFYEFPWEFPVPS